MFVFFVLGVQGFAEAAYYALITLEVILAAELRRGRIRLPFGVTLGVFLAMHILMTPIANCPTFAAFADWFASV